jgi:hypothetical protein
VQQLGGILQDDKTMESGRKSFIEFGYQMKTLSSWLVSFVVLHSGRARGQSQGRSLSTAAEETSRGCVYSADHPSAAYCSPLLISAHSARPTLRGSPYAPEKTI